MPAVATDGSYISHSQPSVDATTHSLLYGRVLMMWAPRLRPSDLPQALAVAGLAES